MIKSFSIKNFQSHKNTKLEFHTGVNAIVGNSDVGKTAILRAMNWVINNKPGGDSFRSNWGGDTIVELCIDKFKIIREKSKQDGNCYHLETYLEKKYGNGDSLHSFKAFKHDIPEEIKQTINFSPLNIQSQMDSSFLLSNSPGEVAKYLNQVVNLDKIDTALKNITRKVKEENHKLEDKKEQLADLNNELEQYNWIIPAEKKLEKIEQLDIGIENTKLCKSTLISIGNEIISIKEKIDKINSILVIEKTVNHLISISENISGLKNKSRMLGKLLENIYQIIARILGCNEMIKLEKRVNTLIKLIDNTKQLKKKFASLKTDLNEIKSVNKNYNISIKQINILEKQFKELMPNICPLCEQKIK